MDTTARTTDPSAAPRVIIAGGGLAGLAAATALGERGVSVTLLESRPRLGGRAGSFQDPESDDWVDHCQHVAMGCCTNLVAFTRRVGLDRLFRRDRVMFFVGPPRAGRPPQIDRLSAAPVPAPLHLWPALARLSFLDRQSRRQVRRGLLKLARTDPDPVDGDRAIDRWLLDHEQSPATIERFWQVILVSALSESLDRISVAAARHVFVTGFLSNRHGWEILVPRVPLEELYGRRLGHWLERHGVDVQTGTAAAGLCLESDRLTGIRLQDGRKLPADHAILAVPHHRLRDLLPASLAGHPELVGIDRIETAPIAGVHLWFDREITELPHAVLVGRTAQWMFNRPSDLADRSEHYLQVVISAAHELAGRPRDEVIGEVVRELGEIWPAAGSARLTRSRLVIERRAVFSPLAGNDRLRPLQQSPLTNLQLAGDWTRTGWPATMEGAVRSGLLAAENVLAQLGHPERLVQPDLPAGRLARWLLSL